VVIVVGTTGPVVVGAAVVVGAVVVVTRVVVGASVESGAALETVVLQAANNMPAGAMSSVEVRLREGVTAG
jgi:hypothetical protein